MEVMCTVLEVKFDIISLVVSSHWLLSRVFQQAEAEAFFFFFLQCCLLSEKSPLHCNKNLRKWKK